MLLPGKRALAVKVIDVPGAGLGFETVRVIEVGVPSVTLRVAPDAVIVPSAALIVAWQIPATLLTGETSPDELTVAHVVSLELQSTLPVRSCVDPSLKLPVADI